MAGRAARFIMGFLAFCRTVGIRRGGVRATQSHQSRQDQVGGHRDQAADGLRRREQHEQDVDGFMRLYGLLCAAWPGFPHGLVPASTTYHRSQRQRSGCCRKQRSLSEKIAGAYCLIALVADGERSDDDFVSSRADLPDAGAGEKAHDLSIRDQLQLTEILAVPPLSVTGDGSAKLSLVSRTQSLGTRLCSQRPHSLWTRNEGFLPHGGSSQVKSPL